MPWNFLKYSGPELRIDSNERSSSDFEEISIVFPCGQYSGLSEKLIKMALRIIET